MIVLSINKLKFFGDITISIAAFFPENDFSIGVSPEKALALLHEKTTSGSLMTHPHSRHRSQLYEKKSLLKKLSLGSKRKQSHSCMKLPNSYRKRALIVIDLQPAFIKTHNKHIVKNIRELIKNVSYDAYIEAVFHAERGSLWDTQQGFTVPQDEHMRTVDEVAQALKVHSPLHVVKETRSAFRGNQDLEAYLSEHGIEEVHLVGTETHDCVLATAFDAFAAGYPVYAIEECCESGTPGRHEVGLVLLRWQSMTNNSCRGETEEIV